MIPIIIVIYLHSQGYQFNIKETFEFNFWAIYKLEFERKINRLQNSSKTYKKREALRPDTEYPPNIILKTPPEVYSQRWGAGLFYLWEGIIILLLI